MGLILFPPPVPGVALTQKARDHMKAVLLGAYPEILTDDTHLFFPPGWTWLVADLLEELDQAVPSVQQRDFFPLTGIVGRLEYLEVDMHIHTADTLAIVNRYSQLSRRTCGRCGAAGSLCREGPLTYRRYCVICRTLRQAQPEEEQEEPAVDGK